MASLPKDMDDHSDVLSNGTAITPGTPVAGVMNSGTDVDAFSFSIASTLDVWVYTTGSLDTRGELFDGNESHNCDRIGQRPF